MDAEKFSKTDITLLTWCPPVNYNCLFHQMLWTIILELSSCFPVAVLGFGGLHVSYPPLFLGYVIPPCLGGLGYPPFPGVPHGFQNIAEMSLLPLTGGILCLRAMFLRNLKQQGAIFSLSENASK